jgi:DNA-binding NarL/FixJ family response regulator
MKLLLADDHTLFRDALVQYIKRANPEYEITVCKDFDEAYEDLIKDPERYDLVILDLRMPGMDGLGGVERLRDEYPDMKVAIMSGVAEPEDVRQALELGVCAYFPKTLSGKALIGAIGTVLNGETYVPIEKGSDRFMPAYYADEKRANFNYGGLSANAETADAEKDINMTPREREVLVYLAQGVSNKEIANALGLQVVTVKLHVRGICRKLEANNRTQAALKATQLGLVESSA